MSETKEETTSSAVVLQDSGKKDPLSRRMFLTRSSAVAVGVTVLPAAGLIASAGEANAVDFGEAYALELKSLNSSAGKTLLKMARDIFPHDKVPQKLYADAIAPYDQLAAKDPDLKKLLNKGIEQLNAAAVARHGKAYADIPGEGERVVLLYEIEQSAFFQKVRGDLIFGLYNNKEVWPYFGYEGSSWEKGGYLDRGFNDINWLPKAGK